MIGIVFLYPNYLRGLESSWTLRGWVVGSGYSIPQRVGVIMDTERVGSGYSIAQRDGVIMDIDLVKARGGGGGGVKKNRPKYYFLNQFNF